MELKIKMTDGAPLPRHARPGDAGLDLTSRETVTVNPGDTVFVDIGCSFEIPDGFFGLCAPRSGLACKHGITFANTPGIIDSGYRGSVKVALHNIGREPYTVERGERVCQIIVVPFASCECVEVDELTETERGEGGFGSSGRN